jgi:PKD repeat protein
MRKALLSSVLSSGLVLACLLTGLSSVAHAASTGATAPQTGRIVAEEPAKTTPNILDGTVYSVVQVGSQIVVGGSFTQVQNPGSSATLVRNHLLAFDAATGKVSTTFAPEPNGTVYKVQAAADGRSVYVGGRFTAAGAVTVKNLFRADVTTGAVATTFKPANLDGEVRDLEVVANRLWVAGKFTHVGGKAQKALGTLNATTGAYDAYFTGVLAGLHNPAKVGSVTDVLQISTNAAGSELVAVGNFTSVDGRSRSQIARFDISGIAYALSPWSTSLYTQACSASFDTYMTDVEYSPDGSYFVVSTTGAYGGSASVTGTSGCDVVARFEDGTSAVATPTWTAYTGGDTTWTVEVTDGVVYAGGHQRWQNNPTAGDRPGQGAVERTGIAALDPVNGMPYSWNPTRTRGVGVQDLLATPTGLYVGSDTTLIGRTAGNQYHARIALLPLSTGKALPAVAPYTLPADVYTVPSAGALAVRRRFDGTTVSSTANAPDGPSWATSVGAFMVNGTLYTAYSSGVLTKQSFDGSRYEPATTVATADALVPQTDWHAGDVPSLTSLFYSKGRIYFTRSGQNVLYSRGFEVEDDIVGQQRFSSAAPAGVTYTTMRGAFVADGRLYYATSTGQLFRAGWSGSAPTGTPVQVSGPGKDAQTWASRVMFVYQGAPLPPNQAPSAAVALSCTGLTCSFDGAGSSDPDGTIASYNWDFGDGSAPSSEARTTHTYAAGGDVTVTLTVTDDRGGTAKVSRAANPSDVANPITFAAAAATGGNRMNHSVKVPATVQPGDTLLLFMTANVSTVTFTGPAGWTPLESQDADGLAVRAYMKVATATDAGTTATVTSSGFAKSDTTLAAYRGTSGTGPVTGSASLVDTTTAAAHVSPAVDAPDSTGWLVTYWADKSAATAAWTAPAGQSVRSTEFGTLTGHISALLADSGAAVAAGPQGRLTATADTAAARSASVSVLLRPAS